MTDAREQEPAAHTSEDNMGPGGSSPSLRNSSNSPLDSHISETWEKTGGQDGDVGKRLGSDNLADERLAGKEAGESGKTPDESIESLAERQDRDENYPEGGLEAWLVVVGSACGLFIVFGLGNSTAAFQSIFITTLLPNYSPQAIGWIFSMNVFFTFFGGIYAGMWFDAHGPRLPVLLGTVGMFVGLMVLGECTKYWHFALAYGALCGISGALIMSPAYASIGHYFKRRRGLATGLANVAGGVSGVVLPLILDALLPKVGFAWSTRVIGFIFLGLSIPTNLFLRKRLPPTISTVSLIPDLSPLLNQRFAIATGGVFLMEWGLFTPIAYVSSYAIEHGQSMSFGFLAITLLNVGGIFGRWVPGLLADKMGRFNVICLTILGCSVSVLALWLPAGNSKALLIVFVLIFGFMSGSNLSLIPVCISQWCHIGEYGRYFAACYFAASIGTLTSVPIAGQLISSAGGSYWGLIVFSGVAYAGALMLYIATRVVSVGWGITAKF